MQLLRQVRCQGLLISLFLFSSCLFSLVVDAVPHNSTNLSKSDGSILKIIETEVWDAPSNIWKALELRWTNERGQVSLAPSEVEPPQDYQFDGEWKIVVSGSDSMGWEYKFQYLQPPKRKRVWLRSLKHKPTLPPPVSMVTRPSGTISRTLSTIRDTYNFKGFSLRFFKSLLSMESMGIGVGLPLTMNFDLWDRNPGLPSVSSSFGLFFPWTIAAFLSASVHVEWIRWVLKTVLYFLPRLLLVFVYRFILPAGWAVATAALLPLNLQLPPIPESPKMSISRPQYNSEISERVGCSVSYRWSRRRGFEYRFNYWHSYLPTFSVYRKFLQMSTPLDWWQKHFGSFGISSGYPLPLPPHFSCSACLGLSGLYFRNAGKVTSSAPSLGDGSQSKISVSSALKDSSKSKTLTVSDGQTQQERLWQPEAIAVRSARVGAGGKATS